MGETPRERMPWRRAASTRNVPSTGLSAIPGIHSQWYGESMSDASASGVLDGLLESLSRCLDAESARRVAHFRVAAHVQERVDMLAERANEGLLTGEERDEYEAFINASDLIAILKLKALRALDSNQHS